MSYKLMQIAAEKVRAGQYIRSSYNVIYRVEKVVVKNGIVDYSLLDTRYGGKHALQSKVGEMAVLYESL